MHTGQGIAEDLAAQFLASRIDFERALVVPYGNRDFRLDRMRDLLARLGNPQEAQRIVHVAGTKGKGSTAAMMGGMLNAAGYRTGLYSSPHLERVEERFSIDGAICPSEELADLVRRVRPIVEAMDAEGPDDERSTQRPTYFEITTALALLRFALHKVDATVLEVGMGGRLDSTNVCNPLVSVITSISYDHTQQLGNSLAEIAREKAGIIKPGIPVVSGVVGDEARNVIAATAQRHGCPLVELGRDFDFVYHPPRDLVRRSGAARMDFTHRAGSTTRSFNDVELALIGRHQAANAAVGMAALAELERAGFEIPEAAVRRGLAEVRWPARIELVRQSPAVVVDSAHNVASVQALAAVLAESFSAPRRVLIFATTRDKNARGMLEVLAPLFDDVIFTRYWTNPRGVPPAELDRLAAEFSAARRHICTDAATAWRLAGELAGPDDLVCATGSLFLAGEIRAILAPA